MNGTTTSFLPAQNLKSGAVWQNENYSIAAENQSSQARTTLKYGFITVIYPLWFQIWPGMAQHTHQRQQIQQT